MDLPIRNMGRVYGANLAPLTQSKVNTPFGFPCFIQQLPPPFCCPGKKVQFKVLNALFPPYPVTAFPAIPEHFAIGKNLPHWPKGIRTRLFLCLPLCFAALVAAFPPLLTGHKVLFTLRIAVLLGRV
ncbi:hypothetical protein AALA54_16970 [Oscillospiraceae bacterium 44-34]